MTFVQSRKIKMISTFQQNLHFRKVSVHRTFIHEQEQENDVISTFAYIPPNVKSPLAATKMCSTK